MEHTVGWNILNLTYVLLFLVVIRVVSIMIVIMIVIVIVVNCKSVNVPKLLGTGRARYSTSLSSRIISLNSSK